MSRPFPYPSIKKDNPSFDPFMSNVLESCVDLHRVVGNFQLVTAPSTSSSAGKPGMFAYDSSYLYVCVDNSTWKRLALSSW